MITAFAPDTVSTTSTEYEYLETQAQTNTAADIPPAFQNIRTGLDKVAHQVAQSFEQAAQAIVQQAWQMGVMLLRMKSDHSRTKYKVFLEQTGWTTLKANRYAKLVKTFEGFDLSQLIRIELTTLFALCAKTYSGVVEQLREMQDITQGLVEQLMKESRLQRLPKQSANLVTGWKPNPSGGGRHYNVVLHDEETGTKIEELASVQKVPFQRVIAEAIAAYKGDSSPSTQMSPYHQAQLEELQDVVNEARSLHAENRRLENLCNQQHHRLIELEMLVQEPVLTDVRHSFSTWEEVEDAVGKKRHFRLEIYGQLVMAI